MNPDIMKFLEEDEDETMHSGADVDAFTAELNRDIEGLPQPPSDFNAALSQGSSQFLPQWHTSSYDGISSFHNEQGLVAMGGGDQHSSELELQRHGSDPQNMILDDNSSHEPTPLLCEPSIVAFPQLQDDRNTLPLPQRVGGQPSGEQPIGMQVLDHEAKLGKELQINKLQNISHQPSVTVGSKSQQSMSVEFNHQQILPTGKSNQQTSLGISSEKVVPPLNQHTTGMAVTSQQAMTSRVSNPQSMSSSSQPVTALKLDKQIPFRMLFPIIQPQLDKHKSLQLATLSSKLKKNEIPKDDFLRNLRSIVGDQMLKLAVTQLQNQAARDSQTATNQFQSQPQVSGRQMQVPSAQPLTDLSSSISNNNAAKLREADRQAVSHGAQVGQKSTSSSDDLCREWKHPAVPTQGLIKKQNMQFSQTSFPTYGSAGSGYPPFPTTSDASSAAIQPQPYDSQMRQAPSHPNLVVNRLGATSRPTNVTNIDTLDKPLSLRDPKKIVAGSLTHMNSNVALQQNQVHCSPSTNKEQKTYISPSTIPVKKEPSDQANEHKIVQMSPSHGLSSLPTSPSKLGSAAPWNPKDESFEIHSSRTRLTPPTTLVPSISVSSPSPSPMETNSLSSSMIPSLTASHGPGNNSKAPPKYPPPSSKKEKVSGSSGVQSIEHLNDVTAVSGVDLREEEENLFSGSKEDSRVSEASRRVVQEEEERLILQKIPLQKIMMEKMAKCGLKNMSNDMVRCLSLCVEERMRGLIFNVIRLSKQRVNMEKPRHKTFITSDVRQPIMAIKRKAHEEWEKRPSETEKLHKLNEPESSTGIDVDKEKDESRGKSTKVDKGDDDKIRTTAAYVAVRAAIGVGDFASRWQLMSEEAKQKQGEFDSNSGSHTKKDLGRNTLTTSTRNTVENQESEKRNPSFSRTTAASVRKVGRNQVIVPRVVRSISVKDVIAVLEREPQLSKSMLLYGLYQKVKGDTVSE